ncbi:MAG: glycosyltransferase family 2 protein [Pseudohongiella sp.]|uniref:glycosyltransferase family 2 protein n=1 Tax=Pseudohongiella sp. TaxID=1979412 RepID=UPI0034A06663
MSVLFGFSAIMLFYVFMGYPLVLAAWARFRLNPPCAGDYEPGISVLIIAYNEQATIRNKILNLLALDYPKNKLQIVIASDASTDGTERIVSEYSEHGIQLHRRRTQSGKPSSLNAIIPQLAGDLVVLMDARQSVAPNCLRALARNFRDASVGAVSGELHLAPAPAGPTGNNGMASGVGFYWRYEKFIRRLESGIDSSVGVSGALYAIRKDLFLTIKPDTLLDDLLIPMNVVRQGYRVVFEPEAAATDSAPVNARSEFGRKVRTIAGNFQLLSRETWLLNPAVNRIWLQTVSHKLLRLTAPVFLLTLLISNAFLLEHLLFRATFLLQMIFYSAALIGMISASRRTSSRALAIPYAFCVLNWATVIGFFRFLIGQQQIVWKR